MNFYKDKIIFTGGSGRFGRIFKSAYFFKNIYYPSKKDLDICNYKSIKKFLKKVNPKIIIHAAAISRPMSVHEKDPPKSIKTNIIATSNLAIVCMEMGIKLIYFSTNYVYPINNKTNKENDPVLPINNYALSKMGGECAVQMCKNSLVLRIFMSESPFVHEGAYTDIKANFLYHEEVVELIPKIINCKGILNIGGKIRTIYDFAKLSKTDVKKVQAKKKLKKKYFSNQIISIEKLKSIIK
jgi:dTDP-4-dehydrorhamnose reductase|tara:strand:- start:396 stop:1115 length:720 start_codon:yes stop_codon:yes gene_type:complete